MKKRTILISPRVYFIINYTLLISPMKFFMQLNTFELKTYISIDQNNIKETEQIKHTFLKLGTIGDHS